MKVLRLSFITLLILALAASFAFALGEYEQTGGSDFDYNLDSEGDFNSARDAADDFIAYSENFNDLLMHPLINDFDGNGQNEIFVQNGDTATIITNKNIGGGGIADTLDLGTISTSDETSNLISFDIDGDNYTEILFWEETNGLVHILEWNGSDLTEENTIAFPNYIQIGCSDINECVAIITGEGQIVGPSSMITYAQPFDASGTTASQSAIHTQTECNGCKGATCAPRIKNLVVDDYDGDGDKQYLASHYNIYEDNSVSGNYDGTYRWHILDNITVIQSGFANLANEFFTNDACFNAQMAGAIFAEVTGSKSNKEVAYAGAADGGVFGNPTLEIVLDSSDGSNIDVEPTTLDSEAAIISNMVVGDFTLAGNNNEPDVCALGYAPASPIGNVIEFTCLQQDLAANSVQYEYFNVPFNLSTDRYDYAPMIHVAQHDESSQTSTQATRDPDEIITPYGVFITNNRYGAIGDPQLELIFTNRAEDSVLLSTDFEQVNADDLLAMKSNQLIYYDDNQQKQLPVIRNITFNPCPVNTVIKANSSIQITVKAQDQNPSNFNGDPINFKYTIYEGDGNELSQISSNISNPFSNQIVENQYTFVNGLNKTIASGRIEIEVWDDFSTGTFANYQQVFQVADNGIEFGDQQCTIGVTVDDTDTAAVDPDAPTLQADNGLVSAVDILAEPAGLDRATALWFILFVLMIAAFVVTISATGDALLSIGFAFLILVVGIILGTLANVFSIGIIISIVVIAIAIVAIIGATALGGRGR